MSPHQKWEHVRPYLLAERTNALLCKLLPYEYQVAGKWYNGYGRFLSDDDLDLWSKVCVIGEEICSPDLTPSDENLKLTVNDLLSLGLWSLEARD